MHQPRLPLVIVSSLIIMSLLAGCGATPTRTATITTPLPTPVEIMLPTATNVPPTVAPATATAAPTMPPLPTATNTPLPSPTVPPTVTSTRSPQPTLAATATSTRTPFPTFPPTPTFTPMPAPTSTIVANLQDQMKPTLPPPPTTPGAGNLQINVMPLQSPVGDSLWLAHTVGMRSFNPPFNHFIEVYRLVAKGWEKISKAELTCPDYLNHGAARQVQLEPSNIWIQVDGGAGAHGGCFDLFSFDGKALKRQASNTYASPGAGRVADLNGDGTGDVILDKGNPYVFCYACGVKSADYRVLRWDGQGLVEVKLSLLPDSAPADLRNLNNRAVSLAQGGLWRDAQATISQTLLLKSSDQTVVWNSALIRLTGDAQAKNLAGAYPLLGHIFYGDYEGALSLMKPYKPEQLFIMPSPLVTGTVAMGWEKSLTQWITETTTLALKVQPDLAGAYFVRGWGLNLTNPSSPAAIADIEKAAQLNPSEPLFVQSVAYFKKK